MRPLNKTCLIIPKNITPSLTQRGFTLIELLIVMVVMGITMGLVMVQLMPDHRAQLREEAERLALLLENAELEAHTSGRTLAWSGDKGSYQFYSQNENGDWVVIHDDSTFRPRTLPEGMYIDKVKVEDVLKKEGEYVLLSAHTITLPFSVHMTTKLSEIYGSATVTGKSTGDVVFSLDVRKSGA